MNDFLNKNIQAIYTTKKQVRIPLSHIINLKTSTLISPAMSQVKAS